MCLIPHAADRGLNLSIFSRYGWLPLSVLEEVIGFAAISYNTALPDQL